MMGVRPGPRLYQDPKIPPVGAGGGNPLPRPLSPLPLPLPLLLLGPGVCLGESEVPPVVPWRHSAMGTLPGRI